jgi:hypothetical protein
MNLLRIESEGQFLRLLPMSERARFHGEWYRGTRRAGALRGPRHVVRRARAFHRFADPRTRQGRAPDPRADEGAAGGRRGPSRADSVAATCPSSDPARARFELAMRELVQKPRALRRRLPRHALLRLTRAPERPRLHDRAQSGAHSAWSSSSPRESSSSPTEDTLQIVSGIVTSRPNFFLTVTKRARRLRRGLEGAPSPRRELGRVRAKVWGPPQRSAVLEHVRFLRTRSALDPIGAAVLDLSRYSND